MPFPSTPAIDTFERGSVENPITGPWFARPLPNLPEGTGLWVSDLHNAEGQHGSQASASYYTTSCGPSGEAWVEMQSWPNGPNEYVYLPFRVQSPGSSSTGYRCLFTTTTAPAVTVSLQLFTNGGANLTPLGGTTTITGGAGDVIGVRFVGTALEVWQNNTLRLAVTEGTYVTSGFIALGAWDPGSSGAKFRQFGGGTLAITAGLTMRYRV